METGIEMTGHCSRQLDFAKKDLGKPGAITNAEIGDHGARALNGVIDLGRENELTDTGVKKRASA